MIDLVARTRGREFAEENAELIIAQARVVGDLPYKREGERDRTNQP